ncbi:hypothetical protein D3C80_387900 [compost metagenome]
MIYYEVVEDIGDGYAASRKFRTSEEADKFCEENFSRRMNGVDRIDTESDDFFYKECEE